MDKTKILKTFLITIFLACNIGLNFAKAADIGNETVNTSTLTANDAITFTSSLGGILNYNTDAIDTLSSISTENDGVGTLQLSDFFEILVINGDIGSATKKINNISFLSYSPLDVNGSIYANSITSGDNYFGILSLYGANSSIQTSIGDATYAIGEINVSAENVSFYEDIYATGFNINSSNSAIIYGTTNVIEDFTMYSSSTLTIDSASQIEITDSATLDDTLNLGILSTSSSDVIIDGTGTANITITDGSSLYFDYADATNISTADTYAFIDNFDGGITVTASNLVVTDNSILLKSSVIADSNSLSLTTSIDSSTTSRLSSRNLSNLNSIFASSNSSLQLSLFKLSTQSTLDDALTSLRIESNNMVQMASFDITNQIDNIIDTRTQSINSHNVNKTIGAITASEDANNKTGSWGSVFGNRTIQGKLEGEEGYKSNTGGVVFGFDKVEKIKNYNSIIGGTFAYSNAVTRSDSVSNQKVSIDSYQFSLYNHNADLKGLGFYSFNSANISYNQYDSLRTITLGSYQTSAAADFSAMQYGAKSSVGYSFKAGQKFILSTDAGLKYSGISLSKYSERGAGDLGLNVKNLYFDFVSSEIGLKLAGNLAPNIEAIFSTNWSHKFDNKGTISKTSLIGSGSNMQKNVGVNILSNLYDFGTQFNIKTGEDKKLMLVYNLQKGNNFTNNTGFLQYVWGL